MERELRDKLINGRFEGTTPERSRIMRAIKGRHNRTTERRFQLALVRARVAGWLLRPKGVFGNPDFWFPAHRIAVFVDGCFWHGCPACQRVPKSNPAFWTNKFQRNANKDRMITDTLRADGVTVLRFWEHELRDDLARCLGLLQGALGDQS